MVEYISKKTKDCSPQELRRLSEEHQKLQNNQKQLEKRLQEKQQLKQQQQDELQKQQQQQQEERQPSLIETNLKFMPPKKVEAIEIG